jgi:DNA modification methylase
MVLIVKNKNMIDIRLSDNLELMAGMQDNTVDLIYCDILYGTGKDFMDYKDLYPIKEIIEEHYWPRIKEMHRVLKDTGSVYLQMDWRINHWVRCIMDDIFGYGNFRNEIIWTYFAFKRKTAKKFPQKHDNIISYTKGNKYTWNVQYKEHSKKYLKRFKEDKNGRLFRDDVNPTSGGFRTIYLDETEGDIIDNVWSDIPPVNPMAKERVNYKTQKPKALIERIIKASSNEGDLVADFYGGSFTTAEVCKDLNRNFIGCDISEKAVAIGLERTKY